MTAFKYMDNGVWKDYIDVIYPPGCVYVSSEEMSPADLFGGTWMQLTDNRFLRPATGSNTTGGASSHIHWTTFGYAYAENCGYAGSYTNVGNSAIYSRTKNGGHLSIWETDTNPSSGLYRENATYSASSLPPYRDMYFWYRTA